LQVRIASVIDELANFLSRSIKAFGFVNAILRSRRVNNVATLIVRDNGLIS